MLILLWLLLGLLGGTAILAYSSTQTPEAEKRFLALGLVVAAVIYVGFSLLWGDSSWLGIELAGVFFYGLFALLALRHSIMWLAIGWFLHMGWDAALHLMGPGLHIVPTWYAYACISYDVLMAGYIVYKFRDLPDDVLVVKQNLHQSS